VREVVKLSVGNILRCRSPPDIAGTSIGPVSVAVGDVHLGLRRLAVEGETSQPVQELTPRLRPNAQVDARVAVLVERTEYVVSLSRPPPMVRFEGSYAAQRGR
jgi:hypothetical protein